MNKTKKRRKVRKGANNFLNRVNKYFTENERLLAKYNLSAQLFINFPAKKKVPLLSRIAIWILKIQGGILDIRLNDLKQNKR